MRSPSVETFQEALGARPAHAHELLGASTLSFGRPHFSITMISDCLYDMLRIITKEAFRSRGK
jgi:hypothetical protein